MTISAHDIRTQFVEQVDFFRKVVHTRILPAFEGLEQEAEDDAVAAFGRIGQSSGPDADPSWAAEMAWDLGVAHYGLLWDIRQSFLNLCAAALHHLFEQQMLLLLRQQILSLHDENDPKLVRLDVLWDRLRLLGIDTSTFRAWPKLHELRCLANAVKHAEGRSSADLAKVRPDLFSHPTARAAGHVAAHDGTYCFLPMAGRDIFVLPQDIDTYADAIVSFLIDLAGSIELPSSPPI